MENTKLYAAIAGVVVVSFIMLSGRKKSAIDISGYLDAQKTTNQLFFDSAADKLKLQQERFKLEVDQLQAAQVFGYNQRQIEADYLAQLGRDTGKYIDNYFYNRELWRERTVNNSEIASERDFQLQLAQKNSDFQLQLAKTQRGSKIDNILNGAGNALGGVANVVSSVYGVGSLFKTGGTAAQVVSATGNVASTAATAAGAVL